MDPDTLVARGAALLEAEVDGELVALGLANDTCYGFNPTATRIWALIEPPVRFAALCDALVVEFAVDRAVCERDVAALLGDLASDGLVRLTPPA